MQNPPVPYLTGEPIPEPEETPPLAEAPAWRRLQYFLFFVAHQSRTTWDIIRWWEKRRFAYNVLVGSWGLVTVLAVALAFKGQVPWQAMTIGPIVIGIAANFCYCLGWIGEIILQRYFVRHRRYRVGCILMSIALAISLLVVSAPMFAIALLAILKIIP